MRRVALIGILAGLMVAPAFATPVFKKGAELDARIQMLSGRAASANALTAKAAIEDVLDRDGLLDPATELAVVRTRSLRDGDFVVRLGQIHHGLPVVGAHLVAQIGTDGRMKLLGGNLALSGGSATAKLPAHRAEQMAARGFDAAQAGKARLVYLYQNGGLHLAWQVNVRGMSADGNPFDVERFFDARSKRMLAEHTNIHTARNRNTYDATGSQVTNFGISGLPGDIDCTESNPNCSDSPAQDAHDYARETYDYFAAKFGRDSLDDNGMTLVSSVHVGSNWNNAAWYNNQMIYGDGDGSTFSPLSGSMDVVAHELSHGVTDFESDLVYANESGAINEALSDIFGVSADSYSRGGVVDSATWLLGEDIYTPGNGNSDALRYMNDPDLDGYSKGYYPERLYPDPCSPSQNNDQCGVHGNSGIANLAFYLMVEGGTHPRGKTSVNVTAIGMAKAEQIFYRAQVACLTSGSDYEALRGCTATAATDLYGSAEADAVHEAWDAVGVPGGDGGGNPGGSELENGVTVGSLSGSTGAQDYWTMDVPSGAEDLSFQISGGSGDADLYVRFGSQPTTSSYDCRPYKAGNNETCDFASPSSGTWHVMIRAYSSYSDVSLVGSYTSSAPNQAPNASFSASTNDLTASFSNTSSDSDGSIASSSWNFGDGATSSSTNPSHTYSSAGTYTVTLTVTDDDGATDSTSQSVTVTEPANVAPNASFSASTSDLTASFSNTSSDSDGSIASSSWNFGDGATSSSTNPSHTYSSAGTYTVTLTVTDDDGATDSTSQSVTVTEPPTGGGLQNGVPVTGLSGSQGSEQFFTVEIPAGATNLSFQMSGGSGDADLYVRYGSAPTTSSYDCRPYVGGNSENCDFASPNAGTWHVMIRAYSSYSGVSLVATWTEDSGGGGCADSGTVTNISGSRNSETDYTWEVPSCASELTVTISGGSGDADLYVRYGSEPTTSSYDCRPWLNGNNETCTFSNPGTGTWYIMIRGYRAYSGVTLEASHE